MLRYESIEVNQEHGVAIVEWSHGPAIDTAVKKDGSQGEVRPRVKTTITKAYAAEIAVKAGLEQPFAPTPGSDEQECSNGPDFAAAVAVTCGVPILDQIAEAATQLEKAAEKAVTKAKRK